MDENLCQVHMIVSAYIVIHLGQQIHGQISR